MLILGENCFHTIYNSTLIELELQGHISLRTNWHATHHTFQSITAILLLLSCPFSCQIKKLNISPRIKRSKGYVLILDLDIGFQSRRIQKFFLLFNILASRFFKFLFFFPKFRLIQFLMNTIIACKQNMFKTKVIQ